MDPWGWEELRPWLELRIGMPIGPLLCVIDGPTRGRPWASDAARAAPRHGMAGASELLPFDLESQGVYERFAPRCWTRRRVRSSGLSCCTR